MYLPAATEETRIEVLHELMRAHPLGTWVSLGPDEELIAQHIPFEVDCSRGEFGTLVGHVARANPIWTHARSKAAHLVSFQGPQAYISPSWYPSKHTHGKAVPTWNYAVVHAYGYPRFIEEESWLRALVTRLTERHEAMQALPWAVADAPADYTQRMLAAIVGVEIPIAKLIGKWKMSQNRAQGDRLGVVAGLMSANDSNAAAVARVMQAREIPQP